MTWIWQAQDFACSSRNSQIPALFCSYSLSWLPTRRWVLVSYQTLHPTIGTGFRGSAKPLLEDFVMQLSFQMLRSLGALGYVHDWSTSSVSNDSSLKFCWLSCHCKSTTVEHTSVPGWQVWEQFQAKITYILEVSNGREVVRQQSVGYFLESPVQYSLGEAKIYHNRLPAPNAGTGKHSMDVDNEGLVSLWQSVWIWESCFALEVWYSCVWTEKNNSKLLASWQKKPRTLIYLFIT